MHSCARLAVVTTALLLACGRPQEEPPARADEARPDTTPSAAPSAPAPAATPDSPAATKGDTARRGRSRVVPVDAPMDSLRPDTSGRDSTP